jgi:predicted nuclease of predicted toxin-antitoxin system
MKFLLNMNLPRVLGRRLVEAGHACRHVGDIGLAQASDREIMVEAERHKEVILTHDLDYGHLLAFSGNTAPSVIIFRLRDSHPERLLVRMTTAWSEIEKPLQEGAIVILEDAALRIRRLPVTPEEERD